LRVNNHKRFDGVLKLERIEFGMLGLSVIIPYRETMDIAVTKSHTTIHILHLRMMVLYF